MGLFHVCRFRLIQFMLTLQQLMIEFPVTLDESVKQLIAANLIASALGLARIANKVSHTSSKFSFGTVSEMSPGFGLDLILISCNGLIQRNNDITFLPQYLYTLSAQSNNVILCIHSI